MSETKKNKKKKIPKTTIYMSVKLVLAVNPNWKPSFQVVLDEEIKWIKDVSGIKT